MLGSLDSYHHYHYCAFKPRPDRSAQVQVWTATRSINKALVACFQTQPLVIAGLRCLPCSPPGPWMPVLTFLFFVTQLRLGNPPSFTTQWGWVSSSPSHYTQVHLCYSSGHPEPFMPVHASPHYNTNYLRPQGPCLLRSTSKTVPNTQQIIFLKEGRNERRKE